ncbi:MAG: hypothetical protein HOV80_02290 [Polyangiaceae bacterium]|nr:hypothetical protein [Polyangiaceae bacterium]
MLKLTYPSIAAPVLVGLMLLAAPAAGQTKPEDKARMAEAAKLFDQANKELDAKKFADACPKIERVIELVPEGVGAKMALGECYEGLGRLASAHRLYVEAEAAAAALKQADRVSAARSKQQALAPKVATVKLEIAPAASRRSGFVVTVDGKPVDSAQTSMMLDAGPHVVRATADGAEDFETRFDSVDGQKKVVTIADLKSKASAAPPVAPPPTEPTPYWNTQRIAGAVVGGAGILVAIGGFAAGGVALSKRDASNGPEGGCSDETNLCTKPAGVDLRDESRLAGNVSTGLLAAGGALAATGLIVFLTAPSSDDGVAVDVGFGRFALGGTF